MKARRRELPRRIAAWGIAAALAGCTALVAAQPRIAGLPSPAAPGSAGLRLPAAPPAAGADLLRVPMPAGSNLRFMVDAGSVVVEPRGVVRYTLVVQSPSGFRNVSYEGLDCAGDSWHTYATWSQAESRWVLAHARAWRSIDLQSNTEVHAVLERDYWCSGPATLGDAARLVRRLRRGIGHGAARYPDSY